MTENIRHTIDMLRVIIQHGRGIMGSRGLVPLRGVLKGGGAAPFSYPMRKVSYKGGHKAIVYEVS